MTAEGGISQWAAPLSELPPVLPVTAWTGHIPFLFLLFSLARPRTFVELGVFLGASFISGCEAAKRYGTNTRCVGIDTFAGDVHAGYMDDETVLRNLTAFVGARYEGAELMRSTFDDAVGRFEDGSIDLLHIDGLHTYEAVAKDFNNWLPKLSDRSIVMFHDTAERGRDFGVWRLWAELKTRYPHFEFHHSHGLGVLATGSDIPPEAARLLAYLEADQNRAALFRTMCEDAGARLPSRIPAVNRRLPDAIPPPQVVVPDRNPSDPTTWGSVSRNEPCPCGSGSRYKHCHGRLA
jgi:hypothetical protein